MLRQKEKNRADIQKLLIKVRKRDKPRKPREEEEEESPKISLGETVKFLNQADLKGANHQAFVKIPSPTNTHY